MYFPWQLHAETFSILADSAFPLVEQVMTPYKGHPLNLSAGQSKFNCHLNSKRQVSDVRKYRKYLHAND